jgi:hypothetical protein
MCQPGRGAECCAFLARLIIERDTAFIPIDHGGVILDSIALPTWDGQNTCLAGGTMGPR